MQSRFWQASFIWVLWRFCFAILFILSGILSLEVPVYHRQPQESVTAFARRIRQETKRKGHESMRQKWEEKPMHGQYPTRVNKPDVDTESTHRWLKSTGLKGETEGLIIAAQD